MSTRRGVFQAIAGPARRQTIDVLSTESENLNAIAEQFDVSRPAMSQQIKVLEECGLVGMNNDWSSVFDRLTEFLVRQNYNSI